MHKRIIAGVLCTLLSTGAAAQFGSFKLPSLGGRAKNIDLESVANNLAKAVKAPTEEEEIALGKEFASMLLGTKPLLANPGMQRYVNLLGRWLASQTERPDLPWTFGVLDDPGFNAFATPGGYVFITRGLMERMRSEAELAGVLAHEIGHVVNKHHLESVQSKFWKELIDAGWTARSGGRSERLNTMLKDAFLKSFASGLDQQDEFEADAMGVVIAARGGFDPFGLPAVLETLQAQSPQDSHFSLMFETHPSPGARIERLDQLMQRRFENMPYNAGKPLNERLKEFGK